MDDDAPPGQSIRKLARAVADPAGSFDGIRDEIARIDRSLTGLTTSVETMDVDVKHLVSATAKSDDLRAVSSKLDNIIDRLKKS